MKNANCFHEKSGIVFAKQAVTFNGIRRQSKIKVGLDFFSPCRHSLWLSEDDFFFQSKFTIILLRNDCFFICNHTQV